VKFDQNMTSKCSVKIVSNLTTKMGDSGSAVMLGEKCVIIEAPNLVSKIDQNKCKTRKMIKKCQKSRNQKNSKIKKMQKTQKSSKSKNQKSSKMTKSKSEKVKKHQKWKTPKNGQNVT